MWHPLINLPSMQKSKTLYFVCSTFDHLLYSVYMHMFQSPVLYQTSQMILSKCVILLKMTIVFYFLLCAQTCVIKSCRSTNTQRDSFDLATKTGTLVTHEEKLSFRGHWSLLQHSPGWHHILLVQSKGLHLWPPTIINHLCPKHQSFPIQSFMVEPLLMDQLL